MTNPYVELSVNKIQRILEEFNYDNPADLLADLIHYANATNDDWYYLLDRANGYVEADHEEDQ